MSDVAAHSGPWYRHFWPWFIAILLGTTVVAGLVTVAIAVRGADALVVEMNTNGGVGAWTEIARHDNNQGLSWTEHFISATDLANLGLTPTVTTRLRFTANDGEPQSIVEAGIDGLEIVAVNCDDGGSEEVATRLIRILNRAGPRSPSAPSSR